MARRRQPIRRALPRPTRRLFETLTVPLRRFLETEAAGGVVLVVATIAAMAWANSPWRHGYTSFWQHTLVDQLFGQRVTGSLGHAVNDGLMVLFFFVIGLEIKREWVSGELRDWRTAALPAVGALGGMVVPALIFRAANPSGPAAHGWGIPMATDIAFAAGVLALLGCRVPNSLRVFLLTLAIVDDIGAILVIALFYPSDLRWGWMAAAAGLLAVVVGLRYAGVQRVGVYVLVGTAVWFATWRSGVHPTIAGVALGLFTPAGAGSDSEYSVAARLEKRLHPWTSFVVVPLFALANAGVPLTAGLGSGSARVMLGVAAGLVAGKAIGISGATWLAVRAGVAELPLGSRWSQIAGIGVLAGIGFTMSLFIADLAFGGAEPSFADHARLAVMGASLVAALAGGGLLAVVAKRQSGRDRVP